jgi:hypothetical protein
MINDSRDKGGCAGHILFFYARLSAVEEYFTAIVVWTHREVNPIGRTALLLNQLIEVTTSAIGDIQQDYCHADHLLRTIATDIHRAARQMIGAFRAATLPIHFLTPIARVDDDRDIAYPIQQKQGLRDNHSTSAREVHVFVVFKMVIWSFVNCH